MSSSQIKLSFEKKKSVIIFMLNNLRFNKEKKKMIFMLKTMQDQYDPTS